LAQDALLTDEVEVGVQGHRAQILGGEAAEALTEVDEVVDRQALVDGHAAQPGVDEGVERDGVADALVDGPLDGVADEVLLAGDAAEVTRAVVLPLAVLQVVEVARADIGQRLVGAEGDAAGAGDVEAGLGVPQLLVEVHGDAVDGLHQFLEAPEVHLHVVVDRDAEVLLDGGDQRVPTGGQRGVYLGLAPVGDGHPEVAREGQELGLGLVGVDPQDHDRVGEDALVDTDGGVVRIEPLGAVGADQQVVLGLAGVDGFLGEDVGADVEALHLVELVVGVAQGRGQPEGHHDHADVEGDQEALRPGPP